MLDHLLEYPDYPLRRPIGLALYDTQKGKIANLSISIYNDTEELSPYAVKDITDYAGTSLWYISSAKDKEEYYGFVKYMLEDDEATKPELYIEYIFDNSSFTEY